jgi:hypothetical protein
MQTRLEKTIKIARYSVLAAIGLTTFGYALISGCSQKIDSANRNGALQKTENYEQFIDKKVEIEYSADGPELIDPVENLPKEIREERIRYEQARVLEQKVQENQAAKPEYQNNQGIESVKRNVY